MKEKGPGIVIAGAGQAGARAAKALRGAGYLGPVRLVGAEPHMPYERPALSKALLLDAAAPAPSVFPGEVYAASGIEVMTGRNVRAIDRAEKRVTLDDGASLAYEQLLLATGSCARRLTLPGRAGADIVYLRTLNDSRALEEKLRPGAAVAVIGAGFIGLEVAASALARGCRVTVLEAAERVLARSAPSAASAHVLAYHRARGIDIRLNARIAQVESGGIRLADGGIVGAEIVVAGIGIVPDTTLAQAAGLVVDDGIVTDETGRTSDPSIFAAGDVTRQFHPAYGRHLRLESWQNANLQADAAARTMAGSRTCVTQIPWLWSDQGALNLQFAGLGDGADRIVIRGERLEEDGIAMFQFAAGRLVGAVTLNRAREMPLIRRLLAEGGEGLAHETLAHETLADGDIPLRKLLPLRRAS